MITAFNTNIKIGEITAKATTQRLNFPMNSFCKMSDGGYLAAGPNGLYTLGGETNDGAVINAYFEIGTTNFGILNPKRIRFIILEFDIERNGIVEVTITSDNGDTATRQFYNRHEGLQVVQVSVSRGFKGTNLKFKVSNVNGCYFAISKIQVVPTILSLRRTRRMPRDVAEIIATGPIFSAIGTVT